MRITPTPPITCALAAIRRIVGSPDYDAYVAHVRRAHPDREPVSRDEFFEQRLAARYNTPGNRCC